MLIKRLLTLTGTDFWTQKVLARMLSELFRRILSFISSQFNPSCCTVQSSFSASAFRTFRHLSHFYYRNAFGNTGLRRSDVFFVSAYHGAASETVAGTSVQSWQEKKSASVYRPCQRLFKNSFSIPFQFLYIPIFQPNYFLSFH